MATADSLPWMESVDAKMRRAKEHWNTLQAEELRFAQSVKPQFILDTDHNPVWIVHYMQQAVPPIHLGILLGECVFQLRSALDNLVCGLIRTQDPQAECRRTQFPIRLQHDDWNKHWQKDLRGVEPAAQRMIHDLQPFSRIPSDPERDPLNLLNELCNSDKHRAVTLALAYTHDLAVTVHANDGKIFEWQATEPLFAGDLHPIPLNLDPKTVEPSARVQSRGTTVLAIGKPGPWELRPALDVLTELHDYVQNNIVVALKPFFLPPYA